jgi:hypothetical protein
MFAALLLAFAVVPSERVIELELMPAGRPQLAAWIEDENQRFVDTIMVTRLIGSYGLGNRPGRPDLGTGYLWPYGKREAALPIWAHRRGVEYDRLVFQDCHERAIRYHNPISSNDPFYCRPTTPAEHGVDAVSCPTSSFASCKGMPLRLIDRSAHQDCEELLDTLPLTTYYPPRNDIAEARAGYDWEGVLELASKNDLDAVSTATPPSNSIYHLAYRMPDSLAPGVYFIWVEANLEGDFNEHTEQDFFHDPVEPGYGVPFLGQPSVVWRVKIEVGEHASSVSATDYFAYGTRDGSDGDLHDPDPTITTGVPGSGAERLLALPGDGARLRVSFDPSSSCETPAPIAELFLESSTDDSLSLSFSSIEGASYYDVRYSNRPITDEATFESAIRAAVPPPDERGAVHVKIDQLQPGTEYSVAARAFSSCGRGSELRLIQVGTTLRKGEAVDACFLATAAYGSKDQAAVVELRRFRDRVLLKSELGRDFVDTYYRYSPEVAEVVRESEQARAIVRAWLEPLAAFARLANSETH